MHITTSFWMRTLIGSVAFLGLAANCGGAFEERVIDAAPPQDPWMKAVGDLNGDGRPDLVLCGRAGPLVWYENPSWTRRTLSTATGSPGTANGIAIGDVDRNGSPDVVLANGVWFANPRPGGDAERDAWARHQIDATTAHDVSLADLDRDGDLDLLLGSENDGLALFRNGGTRTTMRLVRDTTFRVEAPVLAAPTAGDLDGDGKLELVVGGAGGGAVYLDRQAEKVKGKE